MFKPKVAGASPLQAVTGAELDSIINSLRREIRLKNYSPATEETYVNWATRFLFFCHQHFGQSPQTAGPPAITAFLNLLALERAVAPARGRPRPPVVMTRAEAQALFTRHEDPWNKLPRSLRSMSPAPPCHHI